MEEMHTMTESRESVRTYEYDYEYEDNQIEDIPTTIIPAVAAFEDETDERYGMEDTSYDAKSESAKEKVLIYFLICHGLITLLLLIMLIIPLVMDHCAAQKEIIYVPVTAEPKS